MKKIIAMSILVIAMVLSSIVAFAGDVPEALLFEENAQIFFGEVLTYQPNKERPYMEVVPVAVAKGNVKIGEKQTYSNPCPMGDFNVKTGYVYLFTYFEHSDYIDFFEITTYDTRTLKLRHVEGDMWDRLENYLNEGQYGEAKVEGLIPYTTKVIGVSIGTSIFIGVIGVFIVLNKKKSKTYGA